MKLIRNLVLRKFIRRIKHVKYISLSQLIKGNSKNDSMSKSNSKSCFWFLYGANPTADFLSAKFHRFVLKDFQTFVNFWQNTEL